MPDSFRSFLLIILVGVSQSSTTLLALLSLTEQRQNPAKYQIFGFAGQTLLTLGLQREKAGRASLAVSYTHLTLPTKRIV